MFALALVPIGAQAFDIDYVTIGHPGNAADTTTRGAVADVFRIGTNEVTNVQYAGFLNAVDASGANSLDLYNTLMGVTSPDARGGIAFDDGAAFGEKYEPKPNMGSKPVNYVSFWDSTRFANWLHNGQGGGSTETGAYDLTLGYTGGNPLNIANSLVSRSAGAKVWIPSENEWYKAAYHDPGPGFPTTVVVLCQARTGTIANR